MKHRVLAAGMGLVMMFTCLAGCGRKEVEIQEDPVLNYTAPEEGEEIVVIHVRDMGDIKIKLFPELLPEACENFTTLAKEGYYDELIFHRVIEGFMIQGGDPTGTGTGGESCWGGKFDGGYSPQLIHVAGALAYANSAGTSTDGSQFYIVTGGGLDEESLDYCTENYGTQFTEEGREMYYKNGGAPHLDGGNYTVFGQVIDGLDVAFAISKVETDGNNKPKSAVYMDSVTVEQYDGSEIRWDLSDYGLSR